MKCIQCGNSMEVYPDGYETTHLDENGNVDYYSNMDHASFCPEETH